jgi:hypothetical protein
MFHPTDKSAHYRQFQKYLKKTYTQKINEDLNLQDWIPNHQFGFRQAHSRVKQCHRITDINNKAMENQQYCTAAFLDVSQAFDKVCHKWLLFKIERILPSSYFNLPKSYLNECQFETKINIETSSYFHILSGVSQGSILGPLLYVLYTCDKHPEKHYAHSRMMQQYLQLMKTLR